MLSWIDAKNSARRCISLKYEISGWKTQLYSITVQPEGFAQSPALTPPQERCCISILYIYMRRDNFIRHHAWPSLFFAVECRIANFRILSEGARVRECPCTEGGGENVIRETKFSWKWPGCLGLDSQRLRSFSLQHELDASLFWRHGPEESFSLRIPLFGNIPPLRFGNGGVFPQDKIHRNQEECTRVCPGD